MSADDPKRAVETWRSRLALSREAWIGLAIVAVIAGLGVGAFLLLFEKVEGVQSVPLRGEPAVNPYYALERVYEGLGVDAASTPYLRAVPSVDEVVLLGAPTRGQGVGATGELLEWVRAGGHLVVVPVGAIGEDPLLEELGVARFDLEGADDDDHEATSTFESDRPDWPKLWAEDHVDDAIVRSDGPPDAAWLLTVAHGAGAVTVLSDGAFLRNDAIGDEDHALIAWHTVALDEAPERVLIVYRDPSPSVLALFTRRAGPLVWSLAALALVYVLAAARRVGPITEAVAVERRHLAEHIRAAGSYLWSVDAAQSLLDPMREAVRRVHARHVPSGEGDHALVEHLAATHAPRPSGPDASSAPPDVGTGSGRALALPPQRVREAFATRGDVAPQKFIRIVRTLQILRRSS